MGRRYLITGGAGFLGVNLARFLLAKGHAVTSFDIADFAYGDVADRVTVIKGDVRDRGALDAAMPGIDVVVHAAAALPLYPGTDIVSTDVDGTRNVLGAALKHRVERVIHISSTAVYGIPDHHPVLESDRLDGVGHYGRAKIEAESICRAYREKGLCVPVIRPKSFVGPERLGVFSLLFDWAADGKNFPLIGSGKNRYQLLDVEDLCEAVYRAAEADAKTANDTFNIGAKEFATMGEDFQAVLDCAGCGKKVAAFPAGPLIFALRVLEFLRLSPLYAWVYETAAKDSVVSVEKAEKLLGFTPRFSNKDALVRNYIWYRENRSRFSTGPKASHRTVWKQGILRLAKFFF